MVGSGSAHAPTSLAKRGAASGACARRPSRRGSWRPRSRAAASICGPRASWPSAEAKVPPENMACARTYPSTVSGTPSGSCRTVKYAPRSCGTESNPQECTIRAPVSRARASCRTVHEVDEFRLTGQVQIVGARIGAGGHELLAVLQIGADGGGQHPRAAGESAQRFRIGDIRLEYTRVTAAGQPFPQPLELLGAAARDRPAQSLGGVRGEILRGQRADEARGSEQHDVVRASVFSLFMTPLRPRRCRWPRLA